MASGKSDGITPGFTILDTAGDRWFIKFDPPKWREMASGAEVAVTKLFYALGYNVPENHVAKLTRENLVINERSTNHGQRRRRTPAHRRGDIDRLLRMAAQEPDGSYRVIASKALAGKPVGPFLYVGDAVRRSQRHRAARASPRAARPACLCRVDQPRRFQGHQLTRYAGHRERAKPSSVTI